MSNRKRLPDPDLKLLWHKSAGRCAFPDCRKVCSVEKTEADQAKPIGKMAHIVAHSEKGPRGDPDYPSELRDSYENRVLLCSEHHDIVDAQPYTYTCEDLRKWKQELEDWVDLRLRTEMPGVGFEEFEELEIVRKAVLVAPSTKPETFVVVPPTEKMKRNALTNHVRYEITLALSKAKEVEQFVEHMSHQDTDFPERLKQGFVEEYRKQRDGGLEGDALFVTLRDFASGHSSNFGDQAAGLAVLVYLFEKCEVFES